MLFYNLYNISAPATCFFTFGPFLPIYFLLIAVFDWEEAGALQAIYILEVPPLFVFGIPASFIRKSYHHQ